MENKRVGIPRRIYCANGSVIVKTSTRFAQALNAGFVLIQLLYLMHQFLPNIKIKSYQLLASGACPRLKVFRVCEP